MAKYLLKVKRADLARGTRHGAMHAAHRAPRTPNSLPCANQSERSLASRRVPHPTLWNSQPTLIHAGLSPPPKRQKSTRLFSIANSQSGECSNASTAHQANLRRRRRWMPFTDWGVFPRFRPMVGGCRLGNFSRSLARNVSSPYCTRKESYCCSLLTSVLLGNEWETTAAPANAAGAHSGRPRTKRVRGPNRAHYLASGVPFTRRACKSC